MSGFAMPMELHRSRKRTKAGRYAADISWNELEAHFHLPTKKACVELGVGLTVFKRICRKFGLDRWPYRKSCTRQEEQELGDESSESIDCCSSPGGSPVATHTPPATLPQRSSSAAVPEDGRRIYKPRPLHSASSPLALRGLLQEISSGSGRSSPHSGACAAPPQQAGASFVAWAPQPSPSLETPRGPGANSATDLLTQLLGAARQQQLQQLQRPARVASGVGASWPMGTAASPAAAAPARCSSFERAATPQGDFPAASAGAAVVVGGTPRSAFQPCAPASPLPPAPTASRHLSALLDCAAAPAALPLKRAASPAAFEPAAEAAEAAAVKRRRLDRQLTECSRAPAPAAFAQPAPTPRAAWGPPTSGHSSPAPQLQHPAQGQEPQPECSGGRGQDPQEMDKKLRLLQAFASGVRSAQQLSRQRSQQAQQLWRTLLLLRLRRLQQQQQQSAAAVQLARGPLAGLQTC